jgi:hypothetical protein
MELQKQYDSLILIKQVKNRYASINTYQILTENKHQECLSTLNRTVSLSYFIQPTECLLK